MGAIIVITGKAGAGKSTVLSNLACLYAHTNATVGVLSCDLRYASLPYIFDGLDEIPAEKTLGMLFGRADLKDTFTEYKHVSNLFIAAPAPMESCLAYEPPDEVGILKFLNMLSVAFDLTIIEAGEVRFNQLSGLACRDADIIINVVEASLQGIAWEQSCYEPLNLMRGGKTIINVLNEPHGPSSIKDMVDHIGHGIDVSLRHSAAVSNSHKKGLPVVIDANAGFGARRFEKRMTQLYALIGGLMQQ
jgi:MinD-like ATPase involved in chromosome partitioning or flagellar assembly